MKGNIFYRENKYFFSWRKSEKSGW